MYIWLLASVIIATTFATYIFWVRPLLLTRPSFLAFYDKEKSFWAALSLKFSGIKQKVATAVVTIAGIAVMAYDTLAPLVAQSGVDVQLLLPMVPPTAWPAIGMAISLLMLYFRKVGEKS